MIRMRYHVLVKFHRLFPREVLTARPRARRSVADAHNWFGYSLYRECRWMDAVGRLRASLRVWPWQGRAWWYLGTAYLRSALGR
jgi:hypothetical protein